MRGLFALLVAVLIGAGIVLLLTVASGARGADVLVGEWSCKMLTGEQVLFRFNLDGSYSLLYVKSGVVSPPLESATKKLWVSDGQTVSFSEREQGAFGLGKHLLGIRDVGLDVWEIRNASESEVVLGKPDVGDVLVMTRVGTESERSSSGRSTADGHTPLEAARPAGPSNGP